MNASPDFALGEPVLDRQRPYKTMICEGYDGMRQMIRYRVTTRGLAERFIAAPPSWRDQPRPPESSTAALETTDGLVSPNGWLHALISEGAPKHHHLQSLSHLALTLWTRAPGLRRPRTRRARANRTAMTPLDRVIETRAA
jgi:hypothetical protein